MKTLQIICPKCGWIGETPSNVSTCRSCFSGIIDHPESRGTKITILEYLDFDGVILPFLEQILEPPITQLVTENKQFLETLEVDKKKSLKKVSKGWKIYEEKWKVVIQRYQKQDKLLAILAIIKGLDFHPNSPILWDFLLNNAFTARILNLAYAAQDFIFFSSLNKSGTPYHPKQNLPPEMAWQLRNIFIWGFNNNYWVHLYSAMEAGTSYNIFPDYQYYLGLCYFAMRRIDLAYPMFEAAYNSPDSSSKYKDYPLNEPEYWEYLRKMARKRLAEMSILHKEFDKAGDYIRAIPLGKASSYIPWMIELIIDLKEHPDSFNQEDLLNSFVHNIYHPNPPPGVPDDKQTFKKYWGHHTNLVKKFQR